ncbi:calcium-binding protein, partial [Methylobacterium sp. IIF4SW-B5]|nr:calcium-binding protein [Methylobacterium ajmalii]
MQDSLDLTTLIFLGLAVFVIWKLRSVLGQKTGSERPPFNPLARREEPPPAATREGDNVVRLPGA